MEENEKQNENKEQKKPFYKRWWFISLVIIIVICAINFIKNENKEEKNNDTEFSSTVSESNDDETEKFEWNYLELSAMLPQPKSNVGEIRTDSEESLVIDIYNTSKNDYQEFIVECKNKGYIIEKEQNTSSYSAFNEAGYELYLSYYESYEEMDVRLSAPINMRTLKWPTSKIVKLIPTPKSTIGKISSESSDYFSVYIGETSKEDYNTYVDECLEKGFTVDYKRSETYYYADNSDGYHISVDYEGNNVISIVIDAPEEIELEEAEPEEITEEGKEEEEKQKENTEENKKENNKSENKTEKVEETEDKDDLVDGMRPEFKEAMDSYEEFMSDYCDFMEEYAESDGTDLSLLEDYADYMSEYSDVMEDFENWDGEEMNTAETEYYIEVQTRINNKLLEVSY